MFAAPIILELIIGIGTFHIPNPNNDYEFNDHNNLIAVRVGPVIAGTFKNSYYQQTSFVGGVAEWDHDGLVYGFSYGMMHGYCMEATKLHGSFNTKTCEPVWMPYASPYFGIRYEAVTLRAQSFARAVTLSVSIDLGKIQ